MTLRRCSLGMLAVACALVFSAGEEAWAITFDPSASNDIGTSFPGGLVLDAVVSSFNVTNGGLANLYEDLHVNSNGSYNAQFLFNITGFVDTPTLTTKIEIDWQLFTVVAIQGTGVCVPSCGVGSGSWSASTANVFVQLYGVSGTPLVFPVNGRTGISNSTGSGLNAAVTNNTSLLGGQLRNGYLNPSSNSFLEFTEPSGAVGGFAGAGGANLPACIDPSTNDASISPNADCILLAWGSSTTASLSLQNAGLAGGANLFADQFFSIFVPLMPETYAYGANGFFPGSNPSPLNLYINSGPILGQMTADVLSQTGGNNITGQYDTKNQTDVANFYFDNPTTQVPEPGSLALLCSGLLGLVALRRRRRTKA